LGSVVVRAGDAVQEGGGGGDDGGSVVDDVEVETALWVRAGIAEVGGDEGSGEQRGDDDDAPLPDQRVVRGQSDAVNTGHGVGGEIGGEGGSVGAVDGEIAVALCGGTGEVAGMLKSAEHDDAVSLGEGSAFELWTARSR